MTKQHCQGTAQHNTSTSKQHSDKAAHYKKERNKIAQNQNGTVTKNWRALRNNLVCQKTTFWDNHKLTCCFWVLYKKNNSESATGSLLGYVYPKYKTTYKGHFKASYEPKTDYCFWGCDHARDSCCRYTILAWVAFSLFPRLLYLVIGFFKYLFPIILLRATLLKIIWYP